MHSRRPADWNTSLFSPCCFNEFDFYNHISFLSNSEQERIRTHCLLHPDRFGSTQLCHLCHIREIEFSLSRRVIWREHILLRCSPQQALNRNLSAGQSLFPTRL